MTRDDIIRMAREAGFNTNHEMIWINNWEVSPYMQRFAALVAAAEREECARVCEHKMPQPVVNWSDAQIVEALRDCAAAIRARGETK